MKKNRATSGGGGEKEGDEEQEQEQGAGHTIYHMLFKVTQG